VNGEGMKVGPALNGLSKRRSKEWVEKQIRNPQSHTPDSMMPAFDLSASEMDQLVSYLFSLPNLKSFSVAHLR
jgi:cbb3-type cytochrome oxidase cytochrome c subunit